MCLTPCTIGRCKALFHGCRLAYLLRRIEYLGARFCLMFESLDQLH